ncbi:MAG: Asp23/Gls24 family envelope stress response protein [Oscillospiraceae bacterium]|jgi:uncharacterized alkaline shock family protein YloU
MEQIEKSQAGTLKVSEAVIATITRLATNEVSGVEGIETPSSKLKNVFLKHSENDAVKIRLTGDVVEISIGVTVKMGCNVVSIAEEIQENVKSSVQSMTGVTVSRVNVCIAGLVFDEAAKG